MPPYFPHVLPTRKESLKMRQRCPIRMKTLRQTKWSWSRIHLRNRPGQPLLLPRTRYQERRTPTLKIRIGLGKLETRRTNWVGARALPISLDSEALSQRLTCCDRLITMTNILRQIYSRMTRALPPFPPSSSSLFLSSIWWRSKQKTWQPRRTEKRKFETKISSENSRSDFHPRVPPYL